MIKIKFFQLQGSKKSLKIINILYFNDVWESTLDEKSLATIKY
jgi:hypothetical protein